MASKPSDPVYLSSAVEASVKIVIVGPFAVGKTTLVSAVSEIETLRTEATMTEASEELDDLGQVTDKTTTTVVMDFGRITLGNVVLYLFGAPGQDRFQFNTHSLFNGALGGLVLIDTRKIQDSFASMDQLEEAGLPYVVAVNLFDGAPHVDLDELRQALDLDGKTPLLVCDARHLESAKQPLISLVQHLLTRTAMEPA